MLARTWAPKSEPGLYTEVPRACPSLRTVEEAEQVCSRRQTGSGFGVLGSCSQGSAYAVQGALIPEQGSRAKPGVSMSQGVHAQRAAAQDPPVVVPEHWALRTGASRAPTHFQTQGELTLDSRCGPETKTGGCSFSSLLNVIHPSPHKPLASGARGWETEQQR